jgi:hydroxypyruvate isomerase
MNRRNFLATTTAAAAALSAPLSAAPQPTIGGTRRFRLRYAPHFGMFSNHAASDLDQIAFAADQGFTAWEDNGMKGRSVQDQEAIARQFQKRGIQMGIFVAQSIDWSNPTITTSDAGARERFVSETRESLEVAKRLNTRFATTVVGVSDRNRPFGHQFANVVETLKQAAAVCEPAGLALVLEPLNWRDHPGQFVSTSETAYALCKAVGSPSVKILADLYHLQATEGNLIDNMNRCWDEIAYFQLGDNPGRCEPGTGEINYKNVFRHIRGRAFTGILGMEHGKSKDGKAGELALIEAYAAADAD